MKNNLTSQNVVSFIKDIFERRGAEEYLGERVTIHTSAPGLIVGSKGKTILELGLLSFEIVAKFIALGSFTSFFFASSYHLAKRSIGSLFNEIKLLSKLYLLSSFSENI